jgi:Ca2+-binding EF-hand superfamily protein
VRRSLPAVVMLLGAALLAPGAAPPTAGISAVVRPAKADDQLDYLFLGSDRPVLIRLHVRMGDRSHRAVWVEFMDKLFAWFDKDNDGFLSPTEVTRVPAVQSLHNLALGKFGLETQTVPFASIDADKDGKVSREEFRAFYRNGGFQFTVNNFQAAIAKQINDGIYKRLDKAGEGHLNAAKVAGMYEKLRALDENEDEMLDENELNPGAKVGLYYEPDGGNVVMRGPTTANEPTLRGINASQEAALVTQVMDKYDRNKDGKLTVAEVGLAPALFSKLDANKDGSLDAAELRRYFASEPDLVLRLQVGTPAAGKGLFNFLQAPRLVVVNEQTLGVAMKKKFRRAGSDSIAVELGDTRMALQAAAVQPVQNLRSNRGKYFYLREYDRIVGTKKYIERADATGQRRFLFQILSQADKNADGKLTRVELLEWLDLVATGEDATVTITANDLGRGLFPLLDADGDGRLSLREMKSAWAKLRPFSKGGKVTQADIPRTLRIVVGQGNNNNVRPVTVAYGGTSPSRFASRASAPVWFRKMDRNKDGDLSPREWLGTDEEFKAIDTDGDGLISADEAIAFEAKKKAQGKE